MKLMTVLFLFFLGSWETAVAQLTVAADTEQATYPLGASMNFVVQSNVSGPIYYELEYDRLTPNLKSGVLNHVAGQNSLIPFNHTEPALVHCRVAQNNQVAYSGATFAPFELKALAEEPDDLDAYWENAKAALAAVPMDLEIELLEQQNHEYISTYRLSLGQLDNRRVHAFISVPQGDGPFPAILTLPPFGNAPNLVTPEWAIAQRGGALSMAISIHNTAPDQYDPLAYQPDITDERDSLYYRKAVLAAVRAIDYLFSRADFNGRLGVVGVSQGGGLAMIVAGVDSRVQLLVQSNAALCQHAGYNYDRASGFPNYLFKSNTEIGTEPHAQGTFAATQYIDAVFMARRFQGPSLHIVGYQDTICPPATVLTAYNELRGPKILLQARDLGHNHPEEYFSGRYDLFRRHFPSMQTPPWPWPDTSVGYAIDAGDDFETAVEEEETLNGWAELNGVNNLAWTVRWEKVSGPGEVIFSDPETANSSVRFTEAGTYELRYTVKDDYSTVANKHYTLQDYVRVEVLTPTASRTVVEDQSQLNVFPNPGNGPFYVQFDGELGSDVELSVYNLQGQLVRFLSGSAIRSSMVLDFSAEAAGLYLLRLQTGEQTYVQRLLIEP
ncbi:MAG: acetylxylan esterase [Bacteroidota bacterium]